MGVKKAIRRFGVGEEKRLRQREKCRRDGLGGFVGAGGRGDEGGD